MPAATRPDDDAQVGERGREAGIVVWPAAVRTLRRTTSNALVQPVRSTDTCRMRVIGTIVRVTVSTPRVAATA